MRQCQLMRWITTVGICWQQGREVDDNKVSCGVDSVVVWP